MMPAVIVGLAVALSTAGKTVEQLTAQYKQMANVSCTTAAKKVPQLPAANQAAFMTAYQGFNGTDPSQMTAAASKVLADKAVAAFLSAEDSFGPGGFDAALVQCVVITDATPLALAQFAVNGSAEEASVEALLQNPVLMRDMLLGGGPQRMKYGEAASVYTQIVKASTTLTAPRVRDAGLWDDRNQSSVLHRMALATALAFAEPLKQHYSKALIDPVGRYLNFEKAYLAGDLDPYFEVLTVFELRFAADHDGPDEELDWMRETMMNYRPDHIVGFEYTYHWRYARAVRTEVAYGDSVWPDGVARDRDLPAAGAICGGRAFFGRYCRRAFGLPTIRFPQPGHGALITWAPSGWMPLLGRSWPHGNTDDSVGPRSGSDFKLEADAREYRADFQRILRGSWAATALGDKPVSREWTPANNNSYGTGGNWSALIYSAKVIATEAKWTDRALPKVVTVPTKVAALIAKWNVTEPKPSITVSSDGSISIPAAATSFVNASAAVIMMKHLENGATLFHPAGNFIDPDSTAFEYTIESKQGGAFYLTLNFTTWHVNTDLQLTTNATKAPIELPVYYTTGYYKETQPVQVTLVKGKNVLRFVRQLGAGLALREIFLLKSKPVVPPAPGNYTPAPAPPPMDRYIQLTPGLSCESQGIVELDGKECAYAAKYFGYSYSGSKLRPVVQGCYGILKGRYTGNAIFNTNTSAGCCDANYTAICLRS